jgi:hypothetical protein
MKKLILLAALLLSTATFAEEKVDHSAHHPAKEEVKAEAKTEGKMEMADMQGMMNDCMEKNKDNKMCKHDMMKSCSEKMGKKQCSEMMKKMKSHKMNMDGHDMDSMKK